MQFTAEEKLLAMFTAYRALVAVLIDSGTLDPQAFDRHVTFGISRLDAVGETEASSAMAEAMEPLLSDIRRVLQERGGA